jgi:hypothetical protein
MRMGAAMHGGGWDACLACSHRRSAQRPACCHRAQGAAAMGSPTDYEVIASTAPWLTHLSLELPASATALPQEMAGLLAACSKLEDLAMRAFHEADPGGGQSLSSIVSMDALAVGTQLLSLKLPRCSSRLTSLAALGALVNLQSLDMSWCSLVSDLAPLAAMENLQSLDMSWCSLVSDLAPLGGMVNLQRLVMSWCSSVSDLAPLTALLNLESLNARNCRTVSDLAPLAAMVKLQSLDMWSCTPCPIWRPSQPW